jgi:hypothetical protein
MNYFMNKWWSGRVYAIYEVLGQTKVGKDKKVPTTNYNETKFMDFIRYLQLHLKAFVL